MCFDAMNKSTKSSENSGTRRRQQYFTRKVVICMSERDRIQDCPNLSYFDPALPLWSALLTASNCRDEKGSYRWRYRSAWWFREWLRLRAVEPREISRRMEWIEHTERHWVIT